MRFFVVYSQFHWDLRVLLFLISPKFVRTSPYETFIGGRNNKKAGLWIEPLMNLRRKKLKNLINMKINFIIQKKIAFLMYM